MIPGVEIKNTLGKKTLRGPGKFTAQSFPKFVGGGKGGPPRGVKRETPNVPGAKGFTSPKIWAPFPLPPKFKGALFNFFWGKF